MARILVVDDEPGIRQILTRVLQKAGHEAGAASNGEEALQMLREKKYDLAIVDVVMPGKGGVETLIEMRDAYKDLRVIIVSGKVDVSTTTFQGLAGHFGVSRIVKKPYEPETMLGAVEELLREQQAPLKPEANAF